MCSIDGIAESCVMVMFLTTEYKIALRIFALCDHCHALFFQMGVRLTHTSEQCDLSDLKNGMYLNKMTLSIFSPFNPLNAVQPDNRALPETQPCINQTEMAPP